MLFDIAVYIKLFEFALVPVILSVLFLLVEKFTPFSRLPYVAKQLIFGLFFGAAAIFCGNTGLTLGQVSPDVADAAPVCAGLFFGAPAGVVAGVLGGAGRWLFAGTPGAQEAAAMAATVFAGIYAAFLRKYIFDDKRPTPIFGFFTGAIMEIIRMVMLSLIDIDDPAGVLTVVKTVLVPMALFNGAAVWLSSMLIVFILSGAKEKERSYRRISQQVQTPLLISVILAFFATSVFVYFLQTSSAKADAEQLISVNLNDIEFDFSDEHRGTPEELADFLTANRHIGENGYFLFADAGGKIIGGKKTLKGLTLGDAGLAAAESGTGIFEAAVNGEKCVCASRVCTSAQGGRYLAVALIPAAEVYDVRDNITYINSCMEILVFGALFIVVYIIIKRIVVNKIRRINTSLGKIIGGDLDTVVSVRSSDEFASLSDDINSTVSTLRNYINEAAGRIDRELAFAKHIQCCTLPSVFPAFPDRKDFDVFAAMDTAKEVGGDFYDLYLINDNTFGFIIADVSGKGIPAAMFMMTAKTMIKDFAQAGLSVSEIFSRANKRLCAGNEAEMFVTAWMGILDLTTGRLSFVNAGHNPPLLRRANKGFEYLKTRPDLVLSCVDDTVYHEQELFLDPGDELFLYTDGVTEAADVSDGLYGEARLKSLINRTPELSPEQRIREARADIAEFTGSAEQSDDITMLSFVYKGGYFYSERSFPAKTEELDNVLDFVSGCAERVCSDNKTLMYISLSVEEAFVNVAQYAYGAEGGDVGLGVGVTEDAVTVSLSDRGKPFDPLAAPEPDISVDNEKIGGLGIFMIRRQMDDVSYKYENGRNILVMKKRFG